MILEQSEVIARLESPLNLLNRLKSLTNKHSKETHPSLPPSASEVIEDLEEKLAFGSIKSKAASIMISAMDELKARLPEVQKPEKLAQIAAEMSKVVNSETKNTTKTDNTQFIIYAPQQINEANYEVIHARE